MSSEKSIVSNVVASFRLCLFWRR